VVRGNNVDLKHLPNPEFRGIDSPDVPESLIWRTLLNDAIESTTEVGGTTSTGLSRRQVMVGAAWAAPVIALAVATPLSAASDPAPAPNSGGYTSTFDAGVQVLRQTSTTPQRVSVNPSGTSYVQFTVYDPDFNPATAGTYTAGTINLVLNWGAGNGVTTPGSYTLTEQNLQGWTRVGSLPGAGATGTVTYQYTGLLNGAQAILPQVRLTPTSGNALVPSYINTALSATYLSAVTAGVVTP